MIFQVGIILSLSKTSTLATNKITYISRVIAKVLLGLTEVLNHHSRQYLLKLIQVLPLYQ